MLLHRLIWVLVRALLAKRVDLVAENLALRQQLYGHDFTRRVNSLGIKQLLIAPRSPWSESVC